MVIDPPRPQIRILTLNCWGLKYISALRRPRLREIGRQISLSDPPLEIVGLQECWTQEDYEAIREETRSVLPFGKFYFGGIMGAGLAILSRWPIEESGMYEYPLNGRPTAFFRGDWFVGKGVACARIRLPARRRSIEGRHEDEGYMVSVLCTHLHAPYEKEPNDSYLCHRTAQAWEIAKLMRFAAERGDIVIGLGDFNMIPSSFAHKLIVTHAPVIDVWQSIHPDSSLGAAVDLAEQERGRPVPSADFNLLENGVTCDSRLNTWRWTREQKRRARKDGEDVLSQDRAAADPQGKRLDYIFIGGGGHTPWEADSAKVSMTKIHPTLGCSLSDHFAVEASISCPSVYQLPSERRGLAPETYDIILGMIDRYGQRERTQRRWRLTHFVVSVLVSIGCFIGAWWTGRLPYVAFILIVVSTLSFGAGILDGLIGGLFVSSELRALKEFEWEIRNAKRVAEAGEKLRE